MKSPIDLPFNVTESLDKFPKILDYSRGHGGCPCIAFEKHDGTNLAWRWRKDGGDWFELPTFRSGKTILEGMGFFDEAPEIFDKVLFKTAKQLLQGLDEAVLFTEFRGEQSFSGEHVRDDPKTLHPIDLWIKGKGFMPPDEFSKSFNITPIYQGKLIPKFVEDVRQGRLGVNEGVVCKGGNWGSVWCCKIKTNAWLARGGEA